MERTERKPASSFLSLPSTRVGQWSGYLLIVGLVLVVLNSAVILPATESRAGLDTVQAVINIVVSGVVLAAGVCGLLAVLIKRERSWTLFVSIAILFLILGMMVQDLITPGE